jgi:site-specific recombinase XerD
VPVPATVLELLRPRVRGRDDLIFTTPRGMQLRSSDFKARTYDPAVDSGGLPEGLWVHDLRHTAASPAVASGASVKSVQRMLGRASAALMLDVYAGLFDQDLDDVSGRMDGLIRRGDEPGHPPG